MSTMVRPPRWLPNAITGLRVVLVPTFLLLATASEPSRAACLVALVALGASDVVDGWIARRFELATPLGALLDAAADKLAQVALLALFAFDTRPVFAQIPVWFFVLVVARDLLLGAGWLWIHHRRGHVDVVHESHGKIASFLLFLLLVWITAGLAEAVVLPAVLVVTAIVVSSTAAYVRSGIRQLACASMY